mgnify:CR=1 FL=1
MATTAAWAAPVAGAQIELKGHVVVKGGAPFPIVMLQQLNGFTWELEGISAEEALARVGQLTEVRGIVVRAPGRDTWMPSIRLLQSSAAQ